MTILLYSDDRAVRDKVRRAIGRRPAADVPQVEIRDVATQPAVIRALDEGGIDVVILDGEAVPSGGMGVAKTIVEEIYQAPPIVMLIGRPQDAWLATWSQADATVAHPLDPIEVATTVAEVMRTRMKETHAEGSHS